MILIINIIISAVAILLYFGLYIVVLVSKPQNDMKRVFRWYLLAMFFWSLSAILIYTDQTRPTFWFRMMITSGMCTMISTYSLARTFIKERSKTDLGILIIGMLLVGISLISDRIIQPVTVIAGVIHYEFTAFGLGIPLWVSCQ